MAERIDPNWESQLRPQLLQVAQQLRPLRHRLVARLYSQCLITDDEEEKFRKSTTSETDLAVDILHVLRHEKVGSFDKFCEVLLEVGDGSLYDVEKLLRPYRTDSLGKKKICTNFSMLCRMPGFRQSMHCLVTSTYHINLTINFYNLLY